MKIPIFINQPLVDSRGITSFVPTGFTSTPWGGVDARFNYGCMKFWEHVTSPFTFLMLSCMGFKTGS